VKQSIKPPCKPVATANLLLCEPVLTDAPALLARLTAEEAARLISTPPSTLDGFNRLWSVLFEDLHTKVVWTPETVH
jgi:hypothetical protein